MKKTRTTWTSVLAILSMCVLILDARTALAGARDGTTLCLTTVIPALFPFFVVSAVLNANVTGGSVMFLRPAGVLCGIPRGSESLLLLGLIGGYPVGAQAVYDAYKIGRIDLTTAKRLLGFCSNAGPSFIFGILALQFSSVHAIWTLWLIHIITAILVGMVLPGKSSDTVLLPAGSALSFPKALERGIRVIASVCGWVIIFRVIIAVIRRWFSFSLSPFADILITGILELTNGCCNLTAIATESSRFVLCSCLLAFGGLCVLLQTVSVTKEIGIGMYLQGKLLQTLFSFILAGILQRFLYADEIVIPLPCLLAGLAFAIVIVLTVHRKKSSSIIKECIV